MSHRKHWSTRAFEAFLALYPRNFRDEYGRELSLLFADRYRHSTTFSARALVWLDSISGLALEAPKEHCRMIAQDLRYAIRSMGQRPMFSVAIILTLALGIGANSTIFSLVNTVLLRALPLTNPGELYSVRIDAPRPVPQRLSWPRFERLREATPGTSAAMSAVTRVHARPDGAKTLEAAQVQLVSGEYFDVLKAAVVMGRAITPSDNLKPGEHPVAVISHGYWQRRFGGSGDVLTKVVTLNDVHFKIIGVAAAGFSGVWLESPVDAWIPIAMQHDIRYSQNYSADNSRPNEPWMPQERISWLTVILRTRDASSAESALNHTFRLMLQAVAPSFRKETDRNLFLKQRLVLDSFGTGFSRLRERFLYPLYLLMGMAALVLVIACANAANLLLARAVAREREIAVRLSLGSGRLRLIQQLLTESLLLVVLAGIAALLVSQWAGTLLVRMAVGGGSGPAPFDVPTDWRVLAFTMAISCGATLVFGLAPAVRALRMDLSGALKAGSKSVLGVRGGGHTRSLVVLQVAFSLTLVSATGLLIRSFHNLTAVDLGFDREHVVTADVGVRIVRGDAADLHRRILDRVRHLPGVQFASVAMCGVARSCRSLNGGYLVEGYQPAPQEEIAFLVNFVSHDYFETMGMRLIEGRFFDRTDTEKSPHVAIVNHALARKYLGGRSAVGRRIGQDTKLDTQIAGVVNDARVFSAREEPAPMIYYLLGQRFRLGASVVEVRVQGDAHAAVEAVRRALSEAVPEVPVGRVAALTDQVDSTLVQDRLILTLSSAFGALALGLAGFGLFGILSVTVARRTSEFGIRIALGASGRRVRWSVCKEALTTVAIGIALGLPAVLLAARALRTILFGVSPEDWGVFLLAAITLLVVAAGAAFLPAWRASRVDPLNALRIE